MNKKQKMKQELLLKERRIAYWEHFGAVPNISDIMYVDNTTGGITK